MGRVENELRQRKIVRDGTQISFCHIFAHSDSERPPTESKAGDHKMTLFTHDLCSLQSWRRWRATRGYVIIE